MRFAFVALLLASCAPQTIVTGSSADAVVIQHDPLWTGAADLQGQADAECARHGKKAVFREHQSTAPAAPRYARFDCR